MSKKKISKCPEELQELIDTVNLLPDSDEKLFAFEDRLYKVLDAVQGKLNKVTIVYDSPHPPPSFEKLSKQNENFLKIGEKLFGEVSKFEDSALAQKIVRELGTTTSHGARLYLAELYREKQTFQDIIRGFQTWDKNKRLSFLDFQLSNKITVLSFNKGSTLKTGIRVLDILMDKKVPTERLGICPICKKIYYAKRIGGQTCGETKCAQTQADIRRGKSKEKNDGTL